MRKRIFFMISFSVVTLLFLANCIGKKQKQNNQENVSSVLQDTVWLTVYEGTIPCADCAGIKTTLTLSWSKSDKVENTYILKEEYIDRDTVISLGKFNPERGFKDDNDATVIVLNYDKPASKQRYYVYFSNNTKVLHVLNPEKKLIESDLNYKLEQTK